MKKLYSTRVKAPDNSDLKKSTGVTDTQNDAATLNLSRRATTDKQWRTKSTLMKCKKEVCMSTFNVRTLKAPSKTGELVALASLYSISIIALQEHRMYHEDVEVQYQNLADGWQLVTSSSTRNTIGASVGGVGFLLNPLASKSLCSVQKISSRIIVANFAGNPATTVICCYSPTNCADNSEVIQFYDDLRQTTKKTPRHNVLVVLGDLNAQIGKGDKNFTYNKVTNRNGKHLEDYLEECELKAINTMLQKKKGKLWTFQYPNGARSQLDYIAINNKWKNSACDCSAYSSFVSVGSDHRIVTAKLRLSLRATKAGNKRTSKYDWKKFRTDVKLQEAYAVEVQNQFSVLCSLQDVDEVTADKKYSLFIEAHKKTASKTLPKKSKRPRNKVAWEDDRVDQARKSLRDAHKQFNESSSEYNKETFEQAKKELDSTYTKVEGEYLQEKISNINSATRSMQSGLAWATMNEITGRTTPRAGRLRGNTPSARCKEWKDFFSTLLGSPPTASNPDEEIENIFDNTLPIETGAFTNEELQKVLQKMSNGKAAGLDEIPAEVWKTGRFNNILLDICNGTLLRGEKPQEWSLSGIVPIPKKGDLSKATNYRGISLTSIAAKIFNRLILNRIRPHMEPLLRPNQNGFRAERSTTSHILALRRLIEGIKDKQLECIITFIDFKKAFDSVHRGKMLKILKAYGIPDGIVKAIDIMYSNTQAVVISPDGETDAFEILAGVLQGDTLAPYLFIIVLDYVMRMSIGQDKDTLGFTVTPRRSRRYPAEILTDLDFADDIALLSDTLQQAQNLLSRVESAAATVGLQMNASKTKFMTYNIKGNAVLYTIDGKHLDQVNDFQYLGSWVDESEKDFKIRKALAWKACNKMRTLWKSNLSASLKISFFRAAVESILLYGAEGWTLSNRLEARLDGCYTRLLMMVLNLNWKDHPTREEIYAGLPKISEIVRGRRLNFAAHCVRRLKEPVSQLVFWTPTQGRRAQGRPRLTYPTLLSKDAGISQHELRNLMQDRVNWRKFIMASDRGRRK